MLKNSNGEQKQGHEMQLSLLSWVALLGAVWRGMNRMFVLTERGREVTVQGCGNVSTAVSFSRGQVYFGGDVR